MPDFALPTSLLPRAKLLGSRLGGDGPASLRLALPLMALAISAGTALPLAANNPPAIQHLAWEGSVSNDLTDPTNWSASTPTAVERPNPHRFLPKSAQPRTVVLGESALPVSGLVVLGDYTFARATADSQVRLVLGYYPMPGYGVNHFSGTNRVELEVTNDRTNHLILTQGPGKTVFTRRLQSNKHVILDTVGDIEVRGDVSAGRNLVKAGPGTVRILGRVSGSRLPDHARSVREGTLILDGEADPGSTWLIDGSEQQTAATLAGSGRLSGSRVAIGRSGGFPATLAPGSPAGSELGTLTLESCEVVLEPGSILQFRLNGDESTRLRSEGLGSQVRVAPGARLDILGEGRPGGTYTLLEAQRLTGSFTIVTRTGAPPPGNWRIEQDGNRIVLRIGP